MNICEKTCTSTKLHHHAFFFHSISNHYILNVTSLQFHTLLAFLEFRSPPLHMFASITSLLTKCTNIIGLINIQIAPDLAQPDMLLRRNCVDIIFTEYLKFATKVSMHYEAKRLFRQISLPRLAFRICLLRK